MANFQLRECIISEIPLLLLLNGKIWKLQSISTKQHFPIRSVFMSPASPKRELRSVAALESRENTAQAQLRDRGVPQRK